MDTRKPVFLPIAVWEGKLEREAVVKFRPVVGGDMVVTVQCIFPIPPPLSGSRFLFMEVELIPPDDKASVTSGRLSLLITPRNRGQLSGKVTLQIPEEHPAIGREGWSLIVHNHTGIKVGNVKLNLESAVLKFLRDFIVDLETLEYAINLALDGIKIHLDNGANCYVAFSELLQLFGAPERISFAIPEFEYEVDFWLGTWTIKERINNINSTDIRFRLLDKSSDMPYGAIEFTIEFEGNGTEVLGTFHMHFNNIVVRVILEPCIINSGMVSFSLNPKVDLNFDFDMVGVPWYADDIIEEILEDRLPPIVEDEIRNILNEYLREPTGKAIMEALKAVSTRFQSSYIEENSMRFVYLLSPVVHP